MIGPLSLFAVEALELITMGVDTKFGRLSRRVYVRVGPMASLFTITTSSSSSSEMMVAAVEAAASSRGFFGGDIFCFLSKAEACGKQLVINFLLKKNWTNVCAKSTYRQKKNLIFSTDGPHLWQLQNYVIVHLTVLICIL